MSEDSAPGIARLVSAIVGAFPAVEVPPAIIERQREFEDDDDLAIGTHLMQLYDIYNLRDIPQDSLLTVAPQGVPRLLGGYLLLLMGDEGVQLSVDDSKAFNDSTVYYLTTYPRTNRMWFLRSIGCLSVSQCVVVAESLQYVWLSQPLYEADCRGGLDAFWGVFLTGSGLYAKQESKEGRASDFDGL